MAIYDRHHNKLDLLGAVEIDEGHYAVHTRLADKPDAEVELAESRYLRADDAMPEIEAACEAVAASTSADMAQQIRSEFDAMVERVAKRTDD